MAMPSGSRLVRGGLVLLACALPLAATPASATILITEINSNGTGGDFFEIYNSGGSSVSMNGWRWSDYDIRNWAGAFAFDNATLAAGEVAIVVTQTSAAASFKTSWGLGESVKTLSFAGAGAGLGQGDGIILFGSDGNVATSLIYRIAPLQSATTQDLSTVPLSTFTKSFSPQPSANGHAGVMGGGLATESLVWDPDSGVGSPTYRNAVSGTWGAFANPNSAVTIGSPGLVQAVPEPSTVALVGLAAACGLIRPLRRRLRRAGLATG